MILFVSIRAVRVRPPSPRLLRTSACLVTALTVLALTAPAAQRTDTAADTAAAARTMAVVTAIAAADDSAGRRDAIVAALRSAGVEPTLEPFGSGTRAGVNIVATLPATAAPTILVSAHYDRVAVGRGAVDNAAACAALIELVRRFTASSLPGATLTFVFFDREEDGLEGSRAYVASLASRPAYAVNLDIFAYGDTVFATSSHADGVMVRALTAAAAAVGLPVRDLVRDRYPGSDHLTMMAAGIETLGLALVDGIDIDAILRLGVAALKPGSGPRILTIIHTPNDTVAEVRPEQIGRGIAVVERLIRAIP